MQTIFRAELYQGGILIGKPRICISYDVKPSQARLNQDYKWWVKQEMREALIREGLV